MGVEVRDEVRRVELELGALLRRIVDFARLLPALTSDNAREERARLVACLGRGEMAVPNFAVQRRAIPREVHLWVERARAIAPAHPAAELYGARLDELELELALIESLGDARRVRPMAARRYGFLRATATVGGQDVCLRTVARAELDLEPGPAETATIPPISDGDGPSFEGFVREIAHRIGLEVAVRVDPRLVANAATGERTVFVADRLFRPTEARRLAVHEVLGHLVVAANARAQPMKLLEVGTAGSFVDQEGVALWLEEASGLMEPQRRRTIGARYLAASWMHDGASFGEVAARLWRDEAFDEESSIAVAERTFRGGGVARDTAYLLGWLRVKAALEGGAATLDELRAGRVSVEALGPLRGLAEAGLFVQPAFRPSLEYSLPATWGGTSPSTLPPSVATSLTMLELT